MDKSEDLGREKDRRQVTLRESHGKQRLVVERWGVVRKGRWWKGEVWWGPSWEGP